MCRKTIVDFSRLETWSPGRIGKLGIWCAMLFRNGSEVRDTPRHYGFRIDIIQTIQPDFAWHSNCSIRFYFS